MFIDIGFLVCSSTTTKTYLQCTKHTFIGVCWILCAWSLIKNLTGWCRKVFHCSFLCLVIFYFQIHVLLFPSSGSCWLASRILSIMQSSSPSLCEEIKWNSGTKKEKDFVLKITDFSKTSLIFVKNQLAVVDERQRQELKYMLTKQGLHVCTIIN